MSSDTKLQCYRRSCGEMFDPAQNTSESCVHHPGYPVFRDTYKIWSCCAKSTTDTVEFLKIEGCHKTYHLEDSDLSNTAMQKKGNHIKISVPRKFVSIVLTGGDVIKKMQEDSGAHINITTCEEDATRESLEIFGSFYQVNKAVSIIRNLIQNSKPIPQPIQKEVLVRPDVNEALVCIPSVIGASLKPLLENLKKENTQENEKENDAAVQLNTPCQNKECQVLKDEYERLDLEYFELRKESNILKVNNIHLKEELAVNYFDLKDHELKVASLMDEVNSLALTAKEYEQQIKMMNKGKQEMEKNFMKEKIENQKLIEKLKETEEIKNKLEERLHKQGKELQELTDKMNVAIRRGEITPTFFISQLNDVCQNINLEPEYKLIKTTGGTHDMTYTYEVKVTEQFKSLGTAPKKQLARAKAAKKLLENSSFDKFLVTRTKELQSSESE